MSDGLITKEQALELLNMPSELSPAAKLDIVMRLLDPTYMLSDDEKEMQLLRAIAKAAENICAEPRYKHGMLPVLENALKAWKAHE